MRVLIYTNFDVGVYRFRKELLQAILLQNSDVWVALPAGEYTQKIADMGCHVIETPLERRSINPFTDYQLIRQYLQILEQVNPDIVLSYTIKPNIYGGLVCRLRKKTHIANITGLGTAIESGGLLRRFTLMLYRVALSRAKKVFFQNRDNMDFFIRKRIVRQNIALLPGSGVNLTQFLPSPYPSEDTVEFIFIGRLMKAKGIDEYFAAAEVISKKYPNSRFHICGFCEEDYDIKLKQFQDRGIVIYHEMVEDIQKLLNVTHCTIQPSYHEGMSNTVLESAAAARPVIVSDIPGCREAVEDEVTGFLFPKGDAKTLIEKIEKFMSLTWEQKRDMGLAGRRKIEREFNRQLVVDAYIDEMRHCWKNVLLLSLADISTIQDRGIYSDLLREFKKRNHNVFIVSPTERKYGGETKLITESSDECKILKVKTGNIQKTNEIIKGISTLQIDRQFVSAMKKHFKKTEFNLVLYATPPITFYGAVKYLKRKHEVKCYLMLKDIFPQNAVDLNMFSQNGLIYKYFRNRETNLYRISDYIGCMSQANVDYVLSHNQGLEEKTHVSPNCIEPLIVTIDNDKRKRARKKYGIPDNTHVFLYGGNFGKPQDIPFIIECLKRNENKDDRYFVICGTGTEYYLLEKYMNAYQPGNIRLINGLSKSEYDELIPACDVGLIFLDKRFTIPNFPSRLLDYMENYMPVIACTDENTDVGKVITENNFGWWCKSDDSDKFTGIINSINDEEILVKGKNARKYLEENYTAEKSYDIIMTKIGAWENASV